MCCSDFQDVGRVINPLALEGQVEGGVHMGLGQALSEEFVLREGVPVTDTLKSLRIIPAAPRGSSRRSCRSFPAHDLSGIVPP